MLCVRVYWLAALPPAIRFSMWVRGLVPALLELVGIWNRILRTSRHIKVYHQSPPGRLPEPHTAGHLSGQFAAWLAAYGGIGGGDEGDGLINSLLMRVDGQLA